MNDDTHLTHLLFVLETIFKVQASGSQCKQGTLITNWETCNNARKLFESAMVPSTSLNYDDKPKGCYREKDQTRYTVSFNNHATGASSLNGDPICYQGSI